MAEAAELPGTFGFDRARVLARVAGGAAGTDYDEDDLSIADRDAAELALTAAHQTTVNGEPLIRKHGDAWLLNETSRAVLRDHESPTSKPAWYLGTDPENARNVVLQWLSVFGEIRTADLVELCDISRSTATNLISGWEDDGLLVAVGGGRSRRYRKGE